MQGLGRTSISTSQLRGWVWQFDRVSNYRCIDRLTNDAWCNGGVASARGKWQRREVTHIFLKTVIKIIQIHHYLLPLYSSPLPAFLLRLFLFVVKIYLKDDHRLERWYRGCLMWMVWGCHSLTYNVKKCGSENMKVLIANYKLLILLDMMKSHVE